MNVARSMWKALEPYHAVVYFAAEAREAYAQVGLKGYWMGYFASRAAAMGAAGPEIVMATFYNFGERMVRRALPDAWRFSTPALVLEARLRLAVAATKRYPGTIDQIVEATGLAERAARAATPEGRPLFAAHATLPWPDDPHLRLWHAATLLREHRGDTHIAVLLTEQVDGLEAHLLAAAAGQIDADTQRRHRGYTEDEWDAAAERLQQRGSLDRSYAFTDDGRALKERIEERTDRLSASPYEALSHEEKDRLVVLMAAITGAEPAIPFPNAMGLTE